MSTILNGLRTCRLSGTVLVLLVLGEVGVLLLAVVGHGLNGGRHDDRLHGDGRLVDGRHDDGCGSCANGAATDKIYKLSNKSEIH